MAKTQPKAKSVVEVALEGELDAARSRIKDLEEQVDDLQRERDYAKTRHDDEEWLREQLDSLAIDVDTSAAPQNHEQWRRCLGGIASGSDWRDGTWR